MVLFGDIQIDRPTTDCKYGLKWSNYSYLGILKNVRLDFKYIVELALDGWEQERKENPTGVFI